MLIYILRNDRAICFEDKEETIPITLILIMEIHSDFSFVVEVDLNLYPHQWDFKWISFNCLYNDGTIILERQKYLNDKNVNNEMVQKRMC